MLRTRKARSHPALSPREHALRLCCKAMTPNGVDKKRRGNDEIETMHFARRSLKRHRPDEISARPSESLRQLRPGVLRQRRTNF